MGGGGGVKKNVHANRTNQQGLCMYCVVAMVKMHGTEYIATFAA